MKNIDSIKNNKIIVIVIIIAIVLISVITTAVCLKLSNTSKPDEQIKLENKDPNNSSQDEPIEEEELDPEDSIPDYVKDAYNLIEPYIETLAPVINQPGMYRENKVTESDLTNIGRLTYIMKQIYLDGNFDEAENYETEYGEIAKYYPKITKQLVESYEKEYLGVNRLKHENITLDAWHACEFKDNEYYCHSIEGGTGTCNTKENLRSFVSFEEQEDELIIYEKAIYSFSTCDEESNYTYYCEYWENQFTDNNKCGNHLIESKEKDYNDNSEEEKKLVDESGILYKSIFRKNPKGKYYWVSSEPVSNS